MSFNRFFDLPVPGASTPAPKPAVAKVADTSPSLPSFTEGVGSAPATTPQIAPQFTDVSSADTVRRARHLMKAHNYKAAVAFLEPQLETDPDNGAYHNMLGLSYMRMANDDEEEKGHSSNENTVWREKGLKHLRLGSDLQKDRSMAAYDAGSYLRDAGRYEEAHDYLMRALHLNQKDLFAWKVLTEVMIQLKRFDEAVVCLQKAYYCDPRDRQVLEMLKSSGVKVIPVADVDKKARTFGLTR